MSLTNSLSQSNYCESGTPETTVGMAGTHDSIAPFRFFIQS
jgi:hypothetical protein